MVFLDTPFNVKNQLPSKKVHTHTPTNMNYPPSQPTMSNEQWNSGANISSNHLVMNNIPSVPIQHAQPLNNK